MFVDRLICGVRSLISAVVLLARKVFLAFSSSIKMQLFLRAQNTHTLEVTGQETVGQIKVNVSIIILAIIWTLFFTQPCVNPCKWLE